jgi:hypothetical protein
MKKIVFALVIAGVALNGYAAKPEWAGNKEHKSQTKVDKKASKSLSESHEFVSDSETILDDIFSSDEREIIEDYYNRNAKSEAGKHKEKHKELPQGLRKKLARGGELPPGWQKKIARGEVLSADLRYQSTSLPDALLSRLPGSDTATEIVKLKDKVIRVSKGEGTIVDIIDLADLLMKGGQ